MLASLRRARSEWACLEFTPRVGEAGDRTDVNATTRRQVAWALQKEYRLGDSDLVRFALEEEVKWRREDPWQGIGDALEILAALAARERNVENVWVLARAKGANFDTSCGFDIRHTVAAGVAATVAYVRESMHAERDAVLDLLLDEDGEPRVEESDVAKWLAKEPGSLPVDDRVQLDVWFERALSLNMTDIARDILTDWEHRQERQSSMLLSLAYRLEQLESWEEAGAARKEAFEKLTDAFEMAGQACTIARVERLAGEPQQAVLWLEKAAALHANNTTWRELGLARQFVEECFRCATALGRGVGEDMFELAERFARVTPRLPLVALEAAVEAAEEVKGSRVAHYTRLHEREQQRIVRALS